jgi:hypothetical protein
LRYDIFSDKKSIHINLSKEVHAALREKLFRHGISMQDVFCEAAELILSDAVQAQKILDRVAKKRIQRQIEGIRRKNNTQPVGEFDSETLYNLLEENDRHRETDKK